MKIPEPSGYGRLWRDKEDILRTFIMLAVVRTSDKEKRYVKETRRAREREKERERVSVRLKRGGCREKEKL